MTSESIRRRRGGRSARITQRVYAATIAELAGAGLDGLSVESVAERAGVNKVTIYRRWGTRQQLVEDAISERLDEVEPVLDDDAARADVNGYLRRLRDSLTEPETVAILAVLVGNQRRFGTMLERYWHRQSAVIQRILDRAVEQGELPSGVDTEALILQVVGPIWFAASCLRQPVSDGFVQQLIEVALVQAGSYQRRTETSTPSKPDWGRWSTLS